MFSKGSKYYSVIHIVFLPKMKCEVLLFYSECMCKKNMCDCVCMCVCVCVCVCTPPITSPPISVMIFFPFQADPHAETCFLWSEMYWVYNSYYKHFREVTWSPSLLHFNGCKLFCWEYCDIVNYPSVIDDLLCFKLGAITKAKLNTLCITHSPLTILFFSTGSSDF